MRTDFNFDLEMLAGGMPAGHGIDQSDSSHDQGGSMSGLLIEGVSMTFDLPNGSKV